MAKGRIPRARRDRKANQAAPGITRAACLQAAGAALFIPQAGLLAWSVGRLTEGAGAMDLLPAALGIVVIGLLKSLLEAGGSRMAFRSARSLMSQKRATALAVLASTSPLDATRPGSGEVASILGEQADLLVPYLSRFRPARFKASLVPLLILAAVLPFSWTAALILLIAMPLIPLFMALIGWRAQAASEKQLSATGGLNGFLLDRLRGLSTLRGMDAVASTAERLADHGEDLRRRSMAVLRIAFLSSAVLELFAALGTAMIAVYVGFSLLGTFSFGAWGQRLDLSEGLFLLLLAPAFFEPLRELSAVWHDRAAGEAALKALDGLSRGAMPLATEVQTPLCAGTAIRLEKLRFRYRPDLSPVIDAFSLDIRKGEHVALVGSSGSGKSTILSLIAGLAAPEEGHIYVAHADGESGRAGIAWIGQQPHLFSGSLKANILLGRPDEAGRAEAALQFARLGHLAPMLRSRRLGDGGRGFSGGEALRLAIARAAADPEIGLILADEPTAHLDAETAEDIAERLMRLAKGRSLVVATHDPRLIARMDRIVALDALPLREAAE